MENTDRQLPFTSEQIGEEEEERHVHNIEPYLFEPEADELVGAEANVDERPDGATNRLATQRCCFIVVRMLQM